MVKTKTNLESVVDMSKWVKLPISSGELLKAVTALRKVGNHVLATELRERYSKARRTK